MERSQTVGSEGALNQPHLLVKVPFLPQCTGTSLLSALSAWRQVPLCTGLSLGRGCTPGPGDRPGGHRVQSRCFLLSEC